METNINIAEILKNKPQGTKLYSSACGKCQLEEVDDKSFKISFYSSKFGFMNGGEGYLDKNGKLYDDGECVVFPSKEMRDWSKFAWKKGDVLVLNEGIGKLHVIFEGFDDDTYTTFKGKHYLCNYGDNEEDYNDYNKVVNLRTIVFKKDDMNDAQTYINTIEEKLGGKLNLETLEIEKYPEFKDGDIVVTDAVPSMCYSKCIFILKGDLNKDESRANSYIFYNINNNHISFDVLDTAIRDRNIHLATDSEKLQLFDILTKEGKYWDAEKKQIVDLKPKVELKPFDKVLVRDFSKDKWSISFFSFKKKDLYVCINHCSWNQCIPYNEETSHLLGTTDDWEGGEG